MEGKVGNGGMACLGREGMEVCNGGRLPFGNDGITDMSGKSCIDGVGEDITFGCGRSGL